MPRGKGQSFSTEQILAAVKEAHGMVYLAAKKLGCTPQTIYSRARDVAAVREAIDNSRGEMIDAAEVALMKAILGEQPWAIAFTLKTIGKNRGYVERAEVTGEDGGPVEVKIVWDDSTK